MKSVLISIKPQWCELIASGEKTVEVRKTRPKLETPFKCYIYETQGRTETPFVDEEGHYIFKGRGQVIGEFVCDRISGGDGEYAVYHTEGTCLKPDEIADYIDDRYAYFWNISDLVIYDKPRELWEFRTPDWYRDCEKQCDDMERMRCPVKDSRKADKMSSWCRKGGKPITRPPQSWCYVESEDEK